MALIATALCVVLILALVLLNKDRNARTSWALWLPVIWLLIGGSRNVSDWLQVSPATDYGVQYLDGSPMDRNVLALLITSGVVALARKASRVNSILRANPAVLLFFFYCLVSLLWSEYPFVGFKRWIRGAGDMVMILVILTEADWLNAIKRVYARVGFVFLPVSVLFIRYYPDLGRAYGRDGSRYWTGVASGKNGLGMICLIFGIASVWRLILAFRDGTDPARRRQLFVHGVMVGLALWLLWIADSKTSLASFVFATSLIAVTSLKTFSRNRMVVHLMVTAIVGVSFSVLFLGVGSSALETIGRDPTLTGRMDVWKQVLEFAENTWVGAGYETFWLGKRLIEMARYTGGINQAHNGYIEIYLNLGLVGVALLALLIFRGYRSVLEGLGRDSNAGSLKLAYFVMAVVYNFTEGSFKMMSPVWISFLLATMALPQKRPARPVAVADCHSLAATPITAAART